MKSQLILKDKTIYIGEIKNNKPHGRGVIKEEDLDTKEFQIYNPFTQKGEIIYRRINKKFVERNEKKF